MAVVHVNIVPIGTGSTSMHEATDEALKVLKNENMPYNVTSAGTVVEGDLDRIMNVVMRMHESEFQKGIKRVQSTIIIDDRRG